MLDRVVADARCRWELSELGRMLRTPAGKQPQVVDQGRQEHAMAVIATELEQGVDKVVHALEGQSKDCTSRARSGPVLGRRGRGCDCY